MDEYLSIRCIKMLALHTPVFLYKSFDGEGFNILSEELKFLEQNLNYVFMRDVTFVICEPKKQVMQDTGKRTVHAMAYGILEAALPRNINPSRDKLRLIEDLPEMDYDPYNGKDFHLKKSGMTITEAKELHALSRKVKILI